MQKSKYLHFKPTFESPLAYKDQYFDITNSDLCVWSLKDSSLINCYLKISEAYYIKLRIISDNLLLIAENDILKIFDLKEGRIVDKIQQSDFVENVETQPSLGIVVTVVAGSDEKTKVVTKWELNNNTLKKVASVDVKYDDDITESTFSLFIFSSGKIYLHKIESEIMFEIVAEENEFKKNTVPITTSVVLELQNKKNFAVAEEGKISINDPVKGSVFGSIECEGEVYSVILELPGKDSLITSSNKALKLWFLESKSEPKIYQKSQKMLIDKLLIHDGKLIGLSTKTKTLAIWDLQTQQLIKQDKISRQEIQKSFKIGEHYVCLVIKVFDQTEESLTFHHRLELVEIQKDKIVASKEVKNANYLIEVETIIPVDKETIRFICSSDKGDKQKSYLFSWRPFVKEDKKDMSKIQISKTPITKLYAHDRLLLVIPPKEKTQVYQHFKSSDQTTTVCLYTHALKQIMNAQIEGRYEDIEINSVDKVYAIRPQTISIFSLNPKTSTLQLTASIELQITKIYFINQRILCINKENDRALYDEKFQLIMKQQGEGEGIIDILQTKKDELIVSSSESIERWDIKKEEVETYKMELDIIGVCVEDSGKLLLTQSDRIQRFTINSL